MTTTSVDPTKFARAGIIFTPTDNRADDTKKLASLKFQILALDGDDRALERAMTEIGKDVSPPATEPADQKALSKVLTMIMQGPALDIVVSNGGNGRDAWSQILDRYSKEITISEAIDMLKDMTFWDFRKDLVSRSLELTKKIGESTMLAVPAIFTNAFRNAINPDTSPSNAPSVFSHLHHELGKLGDHASVNDVLCVYKQFYDANRDLIDNAVRPSAAFAMVAAYPGATQAMPGPTRVTTPHAANSFVYAKGGCGYCHNPGHDLPECRSKPFEWTPSMSPKDAFHMGVQRERYQANKHAAECRSRGGRNDYGGGGGRNDYGGGDRGPRGSDGRRDGRHSGSHGSGYGGNNHDGGHGGGGRGGFAFGRSNSNYSTDDHHGRNATWREYGASNDDTRPVAATHVGSTVPTQASRDTATTEHNPIIDFSAYVGRAVPLATQSTNEGVIKFEFGYAHQGKVSEDDAPTCMHGPDSLVARTLVAAHVAPHDTTAGGDDAPTCNYETGATTVNPMGQDSDAEDSHSEDEPSVTERC